jgi:hypothetical protein
MSNEKQGRVEREVQKRLTDQTRFQVAVEVKSATEDEDDEEERGIIHHSRNYYWIFLRIWKPNQRRLRPLWWSTRKTRGTSQGTNVE